MRRKLNSVLGLTLSVLFVASAPSMAAQPFGYLNGLSGGQNAGGGILPLTGWALDDDGIANVDIYLDGVIVGRADYGQNNPTVELIFPGYPDGAQNGFGILLDTTPYSNDLHEITARVTSNTGEQVWLNPFVVQINNTTFTLKPFGEITAPNASAELFGTCDLDDPTPRLAVVSGWALDVGIESGDTGIKYVELLINGGLYANTTTDCFYSAYYGGLSNCYGLPSLDIEDLFPTVANSPHARFRFVLDVGLLVEGFGYSQGFHELTVRAGDYAGNFANIAEIPVAFFCDENTGNEGSFGNIGDPEAGEFTYGITEISGWALDAEGIQAIRISIDGVYIADANYGLPRGDVTAAHPGFPDSLFPAWNYLLDTTAFSDGHHHLQVEAVDDFSVRTIIGERYFQINNEFP
ncbi:MAG: hypothetical protein AB7G12_12490 [Thermoanaerobaculia bacterium]